MTYTVQEIRAIVAECRFEDWDIEVRMDGTRPYLQVHVANGRDAETGLPMEWTGRKWMLSPHMCKNEIVATAFKAVMTTRYGRTSATAAWPYSIRILIPMRWLTSCAILLMCRRGPTWHSECKGSWVIATSQLTDETTATSSARSLLR